MTHEEEIKNLKDLLAKANAAVEEAKRRDGFNFAILKDAHAKLQMTEDQSYSLIPSEIEEWICSHNRFKHAANELRQQLAAQQSVPPEARAVERNSKGPTLTAAHYKTAKKIMEMVVAAYLEDPEEIQNSGVGQAIALEIEEHEHRAIIQRTCFPQSEGEEWRKLLERADTIILRADVIADGWNEARQWHNDYLDLKHAPARSTAARECGASEAVRKRDREGPKLTAEHGKTTDRICKIIEGISRDFISVEEDEDSFVEALKESHMAIALEIEEHEHQALTEHGLGVSEDTARLDWLEAKWEKLNESPAVYGFGDQPAANIADLRAAIDAARSANKGKE